MSSLTAHTEVIDKFLLNLKCPPFPCWLVGSKFLELYSILDLVKSTKRFARMSRLGLREVVAQGR